MKRALLISLIILASFGQGIIWVEVLDNIFLACIVAPPVGILIGYLGMWVLTGEAFD